VSVSKENHTENLTNSVQISLFNDAGK